MMGRAELIRRLHKMVDSLAEFPDEFLDDGIYPMVRLDFERDDHRFTLVVGVTVAQDD